MAKSERHVAIITGGAGDIGKASARALIEDGCYIVVVDANPNAAAKVADLGAENIEAHVIDIASEDAIKALIADVGRRLGRIDILVNCAGIHPKRDGAKAMIHNTPTDEWDTVMAVNLKAPFVLFREALPFMSGRGFGRVINIGSRAGRTISPIAAAHYSASKAGLLGLTRVMAVEGAAEGITANFVAPGPVETALTTSLQSVREAIAKTIPVGRYGRPEEIAAAVQFLASPKASFITGAVIDANGGSFMP